MAISMLKITKYLSILLFFCLIVIPIKASSDFSQPSFTGYYTLEPDPPYEDFFYNRAGQTLSLPSQPVAGLSAINVRMSGIDLGLEPGCKAIPYLAVYIVNNYVNQWYLFLPLGTQSTPGGYTPLAADYYFGGSDYAGDPNNLIGHDVLVPFVAREDQNFRNQNELDANGKVIASSTVANLNDIKVFHLYGAHPIYDIWGNTACSQMHHSTWYRHAPFKVLVGHGTDVLTGSQQRSYYSETFGNTIWSDEDLTFTLITSTSTPPIPTKTPVLIVPGVLGTELFDGNELMWADLGKLYLHAGDTDFQNHFMVKGLGLDGQGNSVKSISVGNMIEKILNVPLLSVNIFEGLRLQLESDGYQKDQALFYFPYDWRLDLQQTKDLLKQKIEAIKLQTNSSKVDIIAHSMGGLLVKNYLNSYGKGSVDKLIFVGTPHLGAPKAGKVLLEGDRFGIPWLNDEIMKFLSQNSPAVHELLPSPTYFTNYQGYIKPYKFLADKPFWNYTDTESYLNSQSPSQTFANANSFFAQNLQDMDFSGVDVYNITGCKTGTEAGYQLALGNSIIGQVGYASGDGTVPLPSSNYINISAQNKFYVKNADHSSLPSMDGVRDLISGILKDQITLFSNVSNSSTFCNFKGKTLTWHSPVEVHIYLNGQHTGPVENNGIEYGIPGVGYDIVGHNKFIYLPTDEGQTYNVQATGLETGTFDLQISEINDSGVGNTFVYNDIPVSTGTPVSFGVSDNSQDNQIQVNNQPQDDSAQLTGDEAEDLAPPVTTANVSGKAGQNGWYAGDVSVSLNTTDDNSGVLFTKFKLDSDANFQIYQNPIAITSEGSHTVYYYAVDKAGNNENLRTLQVNIDKTSPEFAVQYNLDAKDFKYLGQDNLDPSPILSCTVGQCTITDKAGNITLVNFVKTNLLSGKSLNIKSVSYNDTNTKLPFNGLVVYSASLKEQLKLFTQTFVIVKNTQLLNITYLPKTNQSIITDALTTIKPVITYQPGIKFLQVYTNQGTIKTIIK